MNSRKTQTLALVKILSYFTVIIPLAFAVVYGTVSLYGRIRKKETLSTQDINVNDHVKKIIKNPSSPKKTELPPLSSEILKFVNIRGTRWLDNHHLDIYFRYLEKTHSEMYVSDFYVIPSINFPLKKAILYDGHFNKEDKCFNKDAHRCSEKTILAYPLHVAGNHWTLVLVDRKERTLEYYDSKVNYGNHEEIKKYLIEITLALTEKDLGEKPYKFICKIKKNLQPDSFQCGPWILYFLENRLKNVNVDFNELNILKSQKMIADHRLKVMDTLIAEYNDWASKPLGFKYILMKELSLKEA
jgi:hypothetical protein